MDSITIKKVIYSKKEIIIKKRKGDLIIPVNKIDYMEYNKENLWTFLATLWYVYVT